MDMKSLEMFAVLARTGSIRQTAELLNTSPTAVARALDKIEYSFDAPLVERGPRGVVLTSAGEIVAGKADHISKEIQKIRHMIGDLKGLSQGAVSLCVNGAAAGAILAPALAEFATLYPNIEIDITLGSAKEAVDAVAQGKADLAVSMFGQPDARVETRFRMALRHELVMAPTHPLARFDTVTLSDLCAYPIAMPDRGFDIRLAFDTRLRNAGITSNPVRFATSSLEVQFELAQRSSAVLILPELTVQRFIHSGDLTVRPLETSARIETLLELSYSTLHPYSFAARKMVSFLETFLSDKHGQEIPD